MTEQEFNALGVEPDSTNYPREYASSQSEIQFTCWCHQGMIAGRCPRTGLHEQEGIDRPVYTFQSFTHPELSKALAMLDKYGHFVFVGNRTVFLRGE